MRIFNYLYIHYPIEKSNCYVLIYVRLILASVL
jgi:hypothetical protein